MKSYCVKQKKQTECVPESERFIRAKNGRIMMKCACIECGATKTKFVSSERVGSGIIDTVGDQAMELFIEHGIPWLGKQAVKQRRYYGSEFLRQPRYQMITNKAKKLSHKGLDYVLDTMSKDLLNKASDKLRPKDMKKGGNIKDWYPMELHTDVTDPTNPLYQRGEGLPIPFPFVDWGKAWNIIRDPGLFKGPEVSAKEGKE